MPAATLFATLQGLKACIDVGGTKVAISIARPTGMHGRVAEPTAKQGASDALGQQLLRMVDESCRLAGLPVEEVDAVSVSSCGPYLVREGLIELAAPSVCVGIAGPARGLPNNWISAILEAPLRARFGTVRVANDGIAALEAERRWGALQGLDHCAYVTWSSGIGTGLCVDGHVLRGKSGNAGHAGYMRWRSRWSMAFASSWAVPSTTW